MAQKHTTQDMRAMFAARGLRTTTQRLAVYQYLLDNPIHPTAARIYEDLSRDYPAMSRATVYNTVDTLAEMGLIQELDLGEGLHRYDGNADFHLHAVCTSCGSITDVEGDDSLQVLEQRIAKQLGFQVQDRRFELFGLCRACAKEKTRN